MIGQAVLVFIAFIGIDIAWARYMICTTSGKALAAAGWSAAITLLAGISTIQYVENNWMLLPAAAGCAVGTVIGMKWK